MLTAVMSANVTITHKDKEYKLGALTLKDIAQFVLDYQFRDFEIAKQRLSDLEPEFAREFLREEYEKCKNKRWVIKDKYGAETIHFLSWETPEVQAFQNTIEGIGLQLYYCLKANHPEITKELANEIVSLKQLNELLDKIAEVHGLKQVDPTKKKKLKMKNEK